MNFIIALTLGYMILLIILAIIKFSKLNRAERLQYLKNFKKGKFALIYLSSLPLYLIGIIYSGISIGESLLLAIKSAIDLVVLKFDYSSIALLMADNFFYQITMIVCFILVAFNAFIFTLTLVGQRILNYFWIIKTTKASKNIYVVIGFNEENKSIIKSINKDTGDVILLSKINEEITDFTYIEKISYVKIDTDEFIGEVIRKLFISFDDKAVRVIINTKDDANNLIYVKQISNLIYEMDLSKYSLDDKRGLNAYVFGEPKNASAFLHLVEKTKGCVHYVNKYKLIAMDFVGKYPLTEFMDQRQIDYESATIKNDVSMNVVMIGFGKTNQQIFLTSIANNQFLTKIDGKLEEKAVNYWIYDKKAPRSDKNLNHNYYRYQNELVPDKSKYLDLPPKPANEVFYELDINNPKFYDLFKDALLSKAGEKPYNYIIIAYGKDMENLDFAEKLSAKIKEWDLDKCSKVFVKIRDSSLTQDCITKEFAPSSGFIAFGNEKEVVYNLSEITSEKKELMAKDRHLSYSLEDGMSLKDELEAKKNALNKWYQQSQVQREANIYACLSIKMKLSLLGFDYCNFSNKYIDASKEFQKLYEFGDPILYDSKKNTVKGRPQVVYSNDYVLGSIRQTLAILEHQRWNAYMITCGIIPSTISQIQAGDSKNLLLRRHGNISTFPGLIEFRKLEAKRLNYSEEDTDVIRYDYQLMDDLVWLLTKNGYMIIKK